ncbi:PEP-CTERM sorting domain-containing protein [cf. Phormidesmis sp. LEGE 11477]|uniref:PEP-CTERM sorting domain-containing protein n=1 Tax=cf. Phormidesmis sp. LEGE 11477 TaxID=1828680 RepID=UPI00187EC84C|nr:PEP-CTERM sorting domain-containing protein [cf. Phormidesmis sp. LEGE 11477]MBE9062337.1 PEP-CTERM sorting domain-containing protein [cf. Phormidesmis sp. LEGE 11477]
MNALPKIAFLGTALLGTAFVLTAPAQAHSLKGSFDLSGNTRVGRPNASAPGMAPVKFRGAVGVDDTGTFSGATVSSTPKIKKLKLTRTPSGTYSTPAVESFISFGAVDFGSRGSGVLTFDLDASEFDRTLPASSLEIANKDFSGSFKLDGNTFISNAFGSFTASRVSGTSFDYDLSVGEPVPEPLTILGSIAAVGLLGVGKRELSKAGAGNSEDDVV